MNIQELRVAYETERSEAFPHFARVIREKNLDAGVLVGIAFGGQAEAILDQTQCGELLGVDAYEPPAGGGAAGAAAANPSAAAAAAMAAGNAMNVPPDQYENLFWYVMGRLSRFGSRYTHVRGSPAQAAQVLNVEVDFVLLDGDRTHAAVFQELATWFAKLRNGGVIGGHGYGHPSSSGVKAAVDGFFASRALTVHAEPNHVWWVEKHV
jgi:hypothetical protein